MRSAWVAALLLAVCRRCAAFAGTQSTAWVAASRISNARPVRVAAAGSEDHDMSADTGEDEAAPLLISLVHHLKKQTAKNDDDDDVGMIRLILASQSPRRREILDMMGLQGRFEATPSPLDEGLLQERLRKQPSLDPIAYTKVLAEEKAKAMAEALTVSSGAPVLVLGSDTIVDLEGTILEKPRNVTDAKATLAQLSGRRHQVHTGVALYSVMDVANNHNVQLVSSFVETANVTFAPLRPVDIDAYVATGEPMDKAGSYGIQGIGGQIVQSIQGDFFTVMGLPMHGVSRALATAIANLLD